MAEFENQEVDEIVNDDIEAIDNEETELTVEDYKKERARREKAEKTLVELKKQLKEKEKAPETGLTEEKLALREELTEFLADNKDLKEYKSELLKYREQGFTMKQAVALVENDDKKIYTKEIYNKIWNLIIETDNIKIEEDYRWVNFNELLLSWLNIYKFLEKKDDADFLIYLIQEFILNWGEKEKLIDFLKKEYDMN